jgi:uroporphyrinogen-III synthase
MRVIVTRPLREAQLWVQEMKAAGLDAVAWPLIEIAPVADTAQLAPYWQHISTYRAVMFVSTNAVTHFFESKPAQCNAFIDDSAINVRAWATGPGTVAALRRVGVSPRCIDCPTDSAPQFDSEALWQVVGKQLQVGDSVLIVRGSQAQSSMPSEGVGRDWFAEQVKGAGARVDFAVAYVRSAPSPVPGDLQRMAQASGSDSVWLLSSSEALANLLQSWPTQSWAKARAITTHARIGEVARAAGFGVVCVSRPSLSAVLASIESLK